MSALSKQVRQWVFEQMEEMAEIDTEEIMDLIRPHYDFDYDKGKEQAIRRQAHSLMARFRDEKGVRNCFACQDEDGNRKYINIDTTTDLEALNAVEKQINSKFNGLHKSKQKIEQQRMKLVEQLTLWESENNATRKILRNA